MRTKPARSRTRNRLLPSGSMATYVGSFRPLIVGASVRFLPSSQSARALARTRAATTLVSSAPITTSTTSPRINSGGRGARLTAGQGSIDSRDEVLRQAQDERSPLMASLISRRAPLNPARGPLAGLRVLDIATMIAAPF